MQERQSGLRRLLDKDWRWAWVTLITSLYALTLLFTLVLNGKVQLEQVRIGRDEGVLSFITGASEMKYQDFLAAALDEEEYPLIGDVGLFLLINSAVNVEGRNARSIEEICVAVIHANGGLTPSDGTCPPEMFATVRTALHRLETLRYLTLVTYANERFQSYVLNVLGEQAISSVRRRWNAAGGRGSEKLGRLDLSYPGLLPNILKARRHYADAINRERSLPGL